mmetsp:Transcript_105644/g.251909  ORF Transcript_105644/g.251909 Transcript_105644/m.251909 type:complete len:216 (+) Transcript_105644:3700-4347(+)
MPSGASGPAGARAVSPAAAAAHANATGKRRSRRTIAATPRPVTVWSTSPATPVQNARVSWEPRIASSADGPPGRSAAPAATGTGSAPGPLRSTAPTEGSPASALLGRARGATPARRITPRPWVASAGHPWIACSGPPASGPAAPPPAAWAIRCGTGKWRCSPPSAARRASTRWRRSSSAKRAWSARSSRGTACSATGRTGTAASPLRRSSRGIGT